MINASRPNVPTNEMSYADCYIRYEHEFLRKIYSKQELEMSKELKSLESFFFLFLYVGFFHEHSRITGLQEKGEDI